MYIPGAKTLVDAYEASIDNFVEAKITDKPLLFTCIEHKAEDIAIHLINSGANPQVTWAVSMVQDVQFGKALQ